MPKTVVIQPGDCCSSLADAEGFRSYRAVYDHGGNSELKKKRPNPNMLLPGDPVEIPDPAQRSVDAASGASHQFVLKQHPVKLRLRLLDTKDKPLKGKAYRLEGEGLETKDAVTPGNGLIECEVPPAARSATLTLDPDAKKPDPPEPAPPKEPAPESADPPPYPPPIAAESYQDKLDPAYAGEDALPVKFQLSIGALAPSGEPEGVRCRLGNLGFDCRGEVGEVGPGTTEAVKAYQRKYGGEVTGSLPDIQSDIEKKHDHLS